MLVRRLDFVFTILGLVLLAVAAWAYLTVDPDVGLLIPLTEMEVADGYPGQRTEVAFTVQNLTRQPIRVVGLASC